MLLDAIGSDTGIDLLARVSAFTQQRQEVLAGNIANIDTPGYKMRDLSLDDFQQDLAQAVKSRSLPTALAESVPLPRVDAQQYMLFQDGNNRSIEKQMTSITANALLHEVAVQLLNNRFRLLENAIRGSI